ncbi:MAG: sarcosine oxidase subunit alpha family protein [Roseinatronobacter sp.]
MSHRLAKGGRLINRAKEQKFTFNGKPMRGLSGDTLAASLLANGQMLLGRSFKYHRPRGVVASGAEEPNALVGLGRGDSYEPNQRTTTTDLFDGLVAESQNHWPSLNFDLLALNNLVPQFLTAGFYYKTFIQPRAFWKHVYEPIIRHSAGLGKAPKQDARDPDRYEQIYAFCDVLVIGGGIAGLQAALSAAQAGAKVALWEQTAHWGGRAPVDMVEIDGQPADIWIKTTVKTLESMDNVQLRLRCMGAGVHDHGYVLGYERISDHAPDPASPRHRLWRMRAGQIITATGAIERPLSFAGNDVPGVMLASAMRDYVVNYAVAPGHEVVVVTNNDDAYRTAITLRKAGVGVAAVVDARAQATGALPEQARAMGIRVLTGKGIRKVKGRGHVNGVEICRIDSKGTAYTEKLDCDAIAMSGGWSPVVHLWSHCGGKLLWDEVGNFFRPDPDRPPLGADGAGFVHACGSAAGAMGAVLAEAHATALKAAQALRAASTPPAPADDRVADAAPMEAVWMMPRNAEYDLRMKMWLDFQNDVTVKDVKLAHQENFRSVEHLKRYTTLGMATDQGKTSNMGGLAVMAELTGQSIQATGTTIFRPPYTPVAMGVLAGRSTGQDFRPTRLTPSHTWATEQGAVFVEVGLWLRAQYFPRAGEKTWRESVDREVLATRASVGVCDVTTLGKIDVQGRDAAAFLNRIYCNGFAKLAVGRVRYGLMLREDGIAMDDGTAARLAEDHFVVTTTTANAVPVYRHMEFARQCLWPDMDVQLISTTEAWAQYAIAGPNARKLLQKIVDPAFDLSNEAFPFMACGEVTVCGGLRARVFRISFSGELAYELAVPTRYGDALMRRLMQAGAEFDVTPYGTEALGVMRIEKGHAAGNELNGQTTARDLGMGRMVSDKKDSIGAVLSRREGLNQPDGLRLVGFRPKNPQARVLAGAHLLEIGVKATAANDLGYVTSACYSPNLQSYIAIGFLKAGESRMGDVLRAASPLTGDDVEVEIVSAHFIDPEGERLRA